MAENNDETPTIHIEATQYTAGREPVLSHWAIGEIRGICHSTQTSLAERHLGRKLQPTEARVWGDDEVIADVEADVKKKVGAALKVKLPEPEPPAAEPTS